MDVAELRQRFPDLLAHFPDEDAAALLAAMTPRDVPKGARLTQHGDPSDTLHLVVAGHLSIFVESEMEPRAESARRSSDRVQSLLLGQAGPGAVVGELGLVDPAPASATVEALEATSTLSIDAARFERLKRESPSAASHLLKAICLGLVGRLRRASDDVVRRIDDHHWMRAQADTDKPRWFGRILALVKGGRT